MHMFLFILYVLACPQLFIYLFIFTLCMFWHTCRPVARTQVGLLGLRCACLASAGDNVVCMHVFLFILCVFACPQLFFFYDVSGGSAQ